ncbi:MAG TPA: aldo/keto reductase [Bacteroidales bacterium]|nr:aldo/keto reductase [Bacteroidales bacterium]
MKKTNRREFLQKSAAGFAGIAVLSSGLKNYSYSAPAETIDIVKLGNTGINVPRVALGTGSAGWKNVSNQTRLGNKGFVDLAQHAYDRGIRFFDTADMYGSHEYVREALKVIPRDNVSILTKVMVYDQEGWYKKEPFQTSLDRFRIETSSEYFDIFLLHCMTNGAWSSEYRKYMDEVSKAKEKGILKTVGISCHDLDAMKEAASNPWVDVLLARINNKGPKMDGTPEEVMKVLETARKNGKGVIGMKVFGMGDLVSDAQREASLQYVIKSGNVHCMTLGLESKEQIDDAVSRVMRIAKS